MKNCILCSRLTRNRKIHVLKTGNEGVVCDYCIEHGRLKRYVKQDNRVRVVKRI